MNTDNMIKNDRCADTMESMQSRVDAMLVSAESVEYAEPKWLIPPFFQRGKGTLIQADPGTGKTAFACAVAAAVTTGHSICGLEVETPGNVLMISVEDDLGHLRGRIERNGGDLSRVYFLDASANLTMCSPEIERAIQTVQAKLVVFDPLQAFLGAKIDMHRANETRPIMAKLFAMCERNDCACAIVAHLSKSTLGKSPVNQSLGSVDIPGSMRSIIHIVRNPDNEEECIAVHVKSSNAAAGKSLVFAIGDRGGVQWRGFTDFGPRDLVAIPHQRRVKRIPYEHDPLVRVFKQLAAQHPAGGFYSYAEVARTAEALLGHVPYESSRGLLARLDKQFCAALMEREGLVIVGGQKGRDGRGIMITPAKDQQMDQTSFALDGGQ